jgi:hypothetical protein
MWCAAQAVFRPDLCITTEVTYLSFVFFLIVAYLCGVTEKGIK